jgi:hypothetical protein
MRKDRTRPQARRAWSPTSSGSLRLEAATISCVAFTQHRWPGCLGRTLDREVHWGARLARRLRPADRMPPDCPQRSKLLPRRKMTRPAEGPPPVFRFAPGRSGGG